MVIIIIIRAKESILEQLIWKVVFFFVKSNRTRHLRSHPRRWHSFFLRVVFAQAFFSLDAFSTYTT